MHKQLMLTSTYMQLPASSMKRMKIDPEKHLALAAHAAADGGGDRPRQPAGRQRHARRQRCSAPARWKKPTSAAASTS
jgi:hypothetical protein